MSKDKGVQVYNMHGAAQFTGRKPGRREGGSYAKFIDYQHDRETLVFVLMDDEHGARSVAKKLLEKRSTLRPNRYLCLPKAPFLLVYLELHQRQWSLFVRFETIGKPKITDNDHNGKLG